MLPGFNHNLRHRGVLFHVQTEDGGARDPKVITQLFFGGRLLAVDRWGYGALAGGAGRRDDIEGVVRQRMMDQHKAMLKRVAAGEFDAAVETRPAQVPPARKDSGRVVEAPTLEIPVKELEAVLFEAPTLDGPRPPRADPTSPEPPSPQPSTGGRSASAPPAAGPGAPSSRPTSERGAPRARPSPRPSTGGSPRPSTGGSPRPSTGGSPRPSTGGSRPARPSQAPTKIPEPAAEPPIGDRAPRGSESPPRSGRPRSAPAARAGRPPAAAGAKRDESERESASSGPAPRRRLPPRPADRTAASVRRAPSGRARVPAPPGGEPELIPAPRITDADPLSEDEILAEIDAELRRQDRPPVPQPSARPKRAPEASLTANWADLASEGLKEPGSKDARSLEDVILDYLAGD
ncbi:MAG: hypothetical protein AAFZ18_14525 [Myxococcota bacterium]